jgi:hypothetical protein
MEIGPVSGVCIAPAVRPKESFLGLTDVREVERTSRTDDETYSPSGAKAATGFEEDEGREEGQEEDKNEYDELEDAPGEEPEELPAVKSRPQTDGGNRQVDYFA